MQTRRIFIYFFSLVITSFLLVPVCSAKSCLWKVASDSGTLYLQGSVHVLKADNYPLAPAIEDAFAKSDILVLETDLSQMMAPDTQQRIMAKALLPDSTSLQETLNESTYAALSEAFDKAGMPIAAMNQLKPWFATMTLTLLQLQKMWIKHIHDSLTGLGPFVAMSEKDVYIMMSRN